MRTPAVLFVITLVASPIPGDEKSAASQWQDLQQRFLKQAGDPQQLARDLMAFQQNWPGTREAFQAAGLLRQLPSALDYLERGQPGEDEPKLPGEVVAVLRSHDRGVTSVAFSPDGELLASASWDGSVKLWRREKTTFVLRQSMEAGPSQVNFHPRGKLLASGSIATALLLWDLTRANPVVKHRLAGHQGRPFVTAFLADGSKLASACSVPQLRLWRLGPEGPEAWSSIGGTEEEKHGITSLAFTRDGRLLATASPTAFPHLKLWQLSEDSMEERTAPPVPAQLVAFPPTAAHLVVASPAGSITLWDVGEARPKKLGDLFSPPADAQVAWKSLTFSPTGDRLAGGGVERKLVLWQTDTGKQVQELFLPASINHLAWAPDGRHLAAASGDGIIYIFRLGSAKIREKR